MTLSNDDVKKIKAVVDANQEIISVRFDSLDSQLGDVTQRLEWLEKHVATKEQLEEVRQMLSEDISAISVDVVALRRHVSRLERAVFKTRN